MMFYMFYRHYTTVNDNNGALEHKTAQMTVYTVIWALGKFLLKKSCWCYLLTMFHMFYRHYTTVNDNNGALEHKKAQTKVYIVVWALGKLFLIFCAFLCFCQVSLDWHFLYVFCAFVRFLWARTLLCPYSQVNPSIVKYQKVILSIIDYQ